MLDELRNLVGHHSSKKLFPGSLTFYLISCRLFESDWRVPLFEALRDQADYYHIRLGKRSILTDAQSGAVEIYEPSEFFRLVHNIGRKSRQTTTPVYFVSMAAALPSFVLALQLFLPKGIWLFDAYDDFSLYMGSRLYCLKGHIVNLTFYRTMTATIIAPPNLRAKFPNAHELPIASSIQPTSKRLFDDKRLIITSVLDGRLDYDFIRDLALILADHKIHIYGRVSEPSRTLPQLERLLQSTGNVEYCGEFVETQYQELLAKYCIALAPFKVNVPFTESTDPSRFYDYLNAGLEVISTDIPRARDRGTFLHIAYSPMQAAEICKGLQIDPQQRKAPRWNYACHSWHYRSRQLLTILEQIASDNF